MGIDVGTSSIKVSVVDSARQQVVAAAQYPDQEAVITSLQPGWAEQSPDLWWSYVQKAIHRCHASAAYHPHDIAAIGIAYQMHGLVLVDEAGNALRDSIIWCDSRAVALGNEAFDAIGHEHALKHLLNSPGNFTASKLAWVRANEPGIYEQIDQVLLPGDYIALRLTGSATCSVSSLSEGVFYDFISNGLSADVLSHYQFDADLFPEIRPVFSEHGTLLSAVAGQLNLKPGIPVSYKAGDQPNNALSLNVLKPGEVAATAGTSGVIYGISDQLVSDRQSRVNTFAHVNYSKEDPHLGVLLCINGTGSLYRWIRDTFGASLSYPEMNALAEMAASGSSGLRVIPFGNGAERMLGNVCPGAQVHNLDLNLHQNAHVFRAAQEGIACAFRYGLDIMRENGMSPAVVRAGMANLFRSDSFTQIFSDFTGVAVELYENDGSVGAAIGAGIGAGIYQHPQEAFEHMKPLKRIEPSGTGVSGIYEEWKALLSLTTN